MWLNDPMKSIPGNMNRTGIATAGIAKTEKVVGDESEWPMCCQVLGSDAYESVEKCEVVIKLGS